MDPSIFFPENYISVQKDWVKEFLIEQQLNEAEPKLCLRTYTVQFSGTKYDLTALINFFRRSIIPFVLDKNDIEELKKTNDEYWQAMQYFGDTDPSRDGKYGELILFLLTEAIFQAPLVAHKIKNLTNPNDQVKGGDGLFFGNYKGMTSIFIGESKIMGSFSTALNKAFESLDRFHQNFSSAQYNYELYLARKTFRKDLSITDLDKLYNNFTPGTEEYKKNIIVHPVLVLYEENKINEIELASLNPVDAELRIKKFIEQEFKQQINLVSALKAKYQNVFKVYLDFFFIPVSDVNYLRKSLYKAIHGVEFVPKVHPNSNGKSNLNKKKKNKVN